MELLGVGSRVHHPSLGDGVVVRLNPESYDVCFIVTGVKEISKEYDKFHIIERIEPESEFEIGPIEKTLTRILRRWSDIQEVVPLGDRWVGGTMLLQPKDKSQKPKEIPIDVFFNKIIMLRDRLRVMEQRINSSNLSEEEKVNLQQYITKIYGTLTTFNVLFKIKEHNFVGESSNQ